jgi:hypothetical protein
MKEYGGVYEYIQIFLTSALAGSPWSDSRPWRFTSGERAPGTHGIGGLVGPQNRYGQRREQKFFDPTVTRTPTPQSSTP